MPDKTSKRKRVVHFNFYATKEEAELIHERMKSAGMVNLSGYFRKMAIKGYHINVDMSDVREMVSLLRRCSNNLNQLTKRVHQNGSIYKADIEDLRVRLGGLWDVANGILDGLAKIK